MAGTVVKRRVDHLSVVRSLIFLCTSVLLTQPHLAAGTSHHCLTVDVQLGQCIGSAGQSTAVPVQCPPNYNLRISSVAVYKSASGCPSTPASDACRHSNVTDAVVDGTCPRNESSCQLTVSAPSSPLHCDLPAYAGDYFVVVDYRCQPVFTVNPATTTALTTYITSDEVRTSALVRVSNDIFGTDIYLYSTTDYCSIHVPGNAQAIVSVSNFDTTSSSPECQQRFQLSQWNSSQTYQLCRSTAPITIDCATDDMDRYFTLNYVTDDDTVGVLVFIDFHVSAWSAVTVQCGTPPVPLNVSLPTTTTTSTLTTTTPATTTTTTTTTTRSTTTAGVEVSTASTSERSQPMPLTTTASEVLAATATTTNLTASTTTTTPAVKVSTTVSTSQPDDSLINAIIISIAVIAAVIITLIVVCVVLRRRRELQPSAPNGALEANTVTMVGRARPSSYVQNGSYLSPPPVPFYVDDNRYKPVVNMYVDADRRSMLVLDRHKQSPLYRGVLRS